MTNEATQGRNEQLIQEMLRDAKTAELPSELRTNPVIHAGDETLPVPIVVRHLLGANYVWVWDTRSFEKICVLGYMLANKLRQRRPDGSFRFTTNDPGQEPKHGTIKCMLHPEGENRKHYDDLGFRACPKNNITNEYQRQQHMVKKHPQEWLAIKAEKDEREKAEDRTLQRLLIAQQVNKIVDKPVDKPVSEQIDKPVDKPVDKPKFICDVCGADFGVQTIMDTHKREKHK